MVNSDSQAPILRNVRLLARRRDLNARGKGTEEYRKIAFPDGNGDYERARWMLDVGAVVKDDWCRLGFRSSERRCRSVVELDWVPVGVNGAIVIDIEKPVGYSGGRASVSAGFLPTEFDGDQEFLRPDFSDERFASVGTKKYGEEWFTYIRFADGSKFEV